MHPLFFEADALSREVIGAAIDVHRHLGPGLMESIYERCLLRELNLRRIPTENQRAVKIEYKGLIFEEELRCRHVSEKLPFSGAQIGSRGCSSAQGAIVQLHETS